MSHGPKKLSSTMLKPKPLKERHEKWIGAQI